MDTNPYLAPATSSLPPPLSGSADNEAIRREHINHEASIKTLGALYLLGGILIIPGGIFMLFEPTKDAGSAMGGGLLALGLFQLALGLGVRKFRPWSRWAATILATLGLLAFPIGTLINALVLSYLLSKKGATVFSPDYQSVIAATPHVKPKTSIAVWIVLGVFILIIVLGLIAILAATFLKR